MCVKEDRVDFSAFTAEAMFRCFGNCRMELLLDFFQDRTRKRFTEMGNIRTSSYAETFAYLLVACVTKGKYSEVG